MMEIITFFLIAISLSFDTFAVSVSSGLLRKEITFSNALKIAICLAFFQTLMPLIGWFAGAKIKEYVTFIDHWIAFILLLLIGLKMIYESLKKEEEKVETVNPLSPLYLITISIATSIDALVIGLTFGFINTPIIMPLAIIGSITFLVSMLGILFGKKAGARAGKKMEILGALILIGIGTKILIQHIYFQ